MSSRARRSRSALHKELIFALHPIANRVTKKKPVKGQPNFEKSNGENLSKRSPLNIVKGRGGPKTKKKETEVDVLKSKTPSSGKTSTVANKVGQENVDDTYQRHFSKTKALLASLRKCLRCVICGAYPNEVYSTQCCDHKYCENCIGRVKGKLCLICDIKVPNGRVKLDAFCTELLVEVENFRSSLKVFVHLHQNS